MHARGRGRARPRPAPEQTGQSPQESDRSVVTPVFSASIPSPSSTGISAGPLFFHAYGLAYVVAVTTAVLIARRRWSCAGGDPALVKEVAIWGFPAGLLGGRIYFLITTPSQVPPHWWRPFAIWKGGLGIWGGIAAGVAGGLFILHRRLPWPEVVRFMDAAAPGLLVAQAIGRVGNYFNQSTKSSGTSPWQPFSFGWATTAGSDHRACWRSTSPAIRGFASLRRRYEWITPSTYWDFGSTSLSHQCCA